MGIQGISYDPLGLLVASLSADRTLRIYHETKKSKKAKSSEWKQKMKIHAIQPPGYDRQVRLWWDDTLPGFVRRLNFSPEGTLLACPGAELVPCPTGAKGESDVEGTVAADCGSNTTKENVDPQSAIPKKECVAIFTRGTMQVPLALLPCSEPSVVTRWCPTLFALDETKPNTITMLPYRMVLAVATSESGIGSVILYETQTMRAFSQLEGMHYANMTDIAWCPTGNHLFVSSRDGYVTRVDFDEGDLGVALGRELDDVRADVRAQLEAQSVKSVEDNAACDGGGGEQQNGTDRLSPKLEKMML